MRCVIITQWYPPEQAPIGYMMRELAQSLIMRGHKVTVITGFPNHPSGEVFTGYRKRWRLRERVDGINVWRMYLATSPCRSKFNRVLTFLSFTLSSAWALLVHPRCELVFAVFQPLTVGVILPLIARLKNAKLVLNVQDLHPDAQIELGLIRNPLLVRLLRAVECFGYRRADGLAVICEYFRDHCLARGAQDNNVSVIPNWVDVDEIKPGNRVNAFRAEIGLSSEHVVVLYAGTIGLVSGAEVVVDAAVFLEKEQPSIRFVFVGEGALVTKLQTRVNRDGLTNIFFVPFQPRARLAEVQAIADISLVTLGKGQGRTSVPSKLLGYMAAGRPVIAVVDGDSETARFVRAVGCGEVINPGDWESLARVIANWADHANLRARLGNAGRLHLEQQYQKEIITDQYLQFFERVVAGK